MNEDIRNIMKIRTGKDEVSTAADVGYREVLVRKGPDAIDSTIALSIDEARGLIKDLQVQIQFIQRHEEDKRSDAAFMRFIRSTQA